MGGFEPHPTTPRRPQETHTLGKACRATCACAVYEQFWHLRCSPLRPPKWRHWHRDRPWGVSQRCRPRWTSTAHFLCSPGDLSLGSAASNAGIFGPCLCGRKPGQDDGPKINSKSCRGGVRQSIRGWGRRGDGNENKHAAAVSGGPGSTRYACKSLILFFVETQRAYSNLIRMTSMITQPADVTKGSDQKAVFVSNTSSPEKNVCPSMHFGIPAQK